MIKEFCPVCKKWQKIDNKGVCEKSPFFSSSETINVDDSRASTSQGTILMAEKPKVK